MRKNPVAVSTVSIREFPWGKVLSIRTSASSWIVLHPEHQHTLSLLDDGVETAFQDKTMNWWRVTRIDNRIRFRGITEPYYSANIPAVYVNMPC
jgi:hypothetical protein